MALNKAERERLATLLAATAELLDTPTDSPQCRNCSPERVDPDTLAQFAAEALGVPYTPPDDA